MANSRRKNISISNENKRQTFIILSVLIYGIFRFFVVRQIGFIGSAYAFTAFDFVMAVCLLLPFAMSGAVFRAMREKFIKRDKFNAKRMLFGGGVIVLIFSIFVIGIILALRNSVCNIIQLKNGSMLALICLLPIILLGGISYVIKGFFRAIKKPGVIGYIEIIHKLSMLVGAILFGKIFAFYGKSVSLVLLNKEYLYAFEAGGIAIGITFSYVIMFIVCVVLYKLNSHIIYDSQSGGRVDDIYDIMNTLNPEIRKESWSLLFCMLSLVIPECFYFFTMRNEDRIVISYNIGAVVGGLLSLYAMPLLWVFSDTYNQRRQLAIAIKENNISELKIKINGIVRDTLIVAIPAAVFSFALANSISSGIFGFESDLLAKLIRTGILAIVPLSFVAMNINIMNGFYKSSSSVHYSFVSMLAALLVSVLLIFAFKLGIYGILIGIYIYSIGYSVLSFLAIKKKLKRNRIEILEYLIYIGIASVISGVVIFFLGLVLSLFLYDFVVVLICFVVFVLLLSVILMKLKIIDRYLLKKSPVGFVFIFIGDLFKLL